MKRYRPKHTQLKGAQRHMVSGKNKRKIDYNGQSFYWFVRINSENQYRIHILSEDKAINLQYPRFDSEVPVTPVYIRKLLDEYFTSK